jgi:predicted MFS family arabinose efflux permease
MLYMPVVKLYYEENHLNNFELFLLHGIYSIIIAISEIPSGYAADVWGRKKTMITGLFFGFIGFAVYSVTHSFWGFLLAEVVLGIGQGFTSGCDTALLYDSLQEQKKENLYIKMEGNITATGNIAEAFAGISVTLLAFAVIRYYYYIQTFIALISFLIAFFLVEPFVHHHEEKNWSSIIDTVKHSLWKNKLLSGYIIFSSIIGFASLSMAWFAQIFLYKAGLPKTYFGVTWTGLNLMVAIGSLLSAWIYRKLGIRKALLYILLFSSFGFLLASQTISIYGIFLLSVFYFVRGTAHPIMKDRINSLTKSNVRATVLSIRSFIIRILFFALGPFLGWITDKYSLSLALELSAITILIPGTIMVIVISRAKKLTT